MPARTLGQAHEEDRGAHDPQAAPRLTLAGGGAVTQSRRTRGVTATDQEIVTGLRQGEPWAADQLYERVHVSVQRTLRRILRYGDGELEDLMQESFERMLRVLAERPLGGACNLPGWAAAVTAHLALDRLRKRTREQRILRRETAPEDGDVRPSVERNLEARSKLSRVQGTLGRMRPQYAETLVLHDVLGHDLSEVAEITGVSVSAAQSRLVRGRRDFRRRTGTNP